MLRPLQRNFIAWIQDFVDTYKSKIGRPPMIFTSHDVWEECVGNSAVLADQDLPLVLSFWEEKLITPPGTWKEYTFWQYTDKYKFGGDELYFHGHKKELKKFANHK